MPANVPPDIDDPTIANSEWLYFRVYPGQGMIQQSDEEGVFRPASGSLKGNEPFSVDLGSLCWPEQTRDRDPSKPWHVAGFTAGTARKHGCRIVRDPIVGDDKEPPNPAHALVFGDGDNGSLAYKKQGKKIAREAKIVLLNRNAAHVTDLP
jgi:hypothetical protein